MKSLITILGLGILLTFSACFIDGDEGPQGPRGFDGAQGEPGEEAFVFDFEGVSFTGPDYEVIIPYAAGFTALETDVTFVYFLWGEDEADNGELVEVWRALPQTLITEDGILQYNYDFSIFDVKLFLDANFPLDLLTAIDTDDWVVRIVVAPGKYWSGGRKEYPSYEEVMSWYGLDRVKTYSDVTPRRF